MQSGLSFLLHQDVQRIFNNFTTLFQIRIALYTPEGEEVKVGCNQDLCSYCRLIRLSAAGESACREQDCHARGKALESQSPSVYTCHAGLEEAILPLYHESTLLAFVMIGQIRTRKRVPSLPFLATEPIQQTLELQKAFEELPIKRANELSRIIELFHDLMNLITERSLIQIKHDARLGKLLSALEQSPGMFPRIEDAAALLNLSPSRLSHLLKDELNTTFTELSRSYRLSHARSRLVKSTHPIKRIALDSGFNDPRYFSRLFKREFGDSPESFRRRHLSPPG